MSTEYTFDGLDEWEKNLAQVIDQQYPEEFKQMVIDIAERTLGRAKELTPVQTGHLRNAWNLGTIEKRGDTYYIEIYNNVEYAEPVEYVLDRSYDNTVSVDVDAQRNYLEGRGTDTSEIEDISAEAQKALVSVENSGSVSGVPNDFRAVSGYSIIVQDEVSGLYGQFYIESDTHTFTNGKAQMDLTLAFENLMDEEEIEKDTNNKKSK